MSELRYSPPQEIRSAVWLMLNVISLGVIQLRERLGLTPHTPLLPRHAISRLSRFLAQAEPALRRCLYLCAAELGALPVFPRETASSGPARPRKTTQHIAPHPSQLSVCSRPALIARMQSRPGRHSRQAHASAFLMRTTSQISMNTINSRATSCPPNASSAG